MSYIINFPRILATDLQSIVIDITESQYIVLVVFISWTVERLHTFDFYVKIHNFFLQISPVAHRKRQVADEYYKYA